MALTGTAEDDLKPETSRVKRAFRIVAYGALAVGFVALVALAALYLRLAAQPISLADHTGRFAEAIASRIGTGWQVRLGAADLELSGVVPAVRTAGLEIRNPDGVLVVRAPRAVVSVGPLSVLTGSPALRRIELWNLQLRAILGPDGSLSFMSTLDGDGEAGAPSVPAPAPAPRSPADAVAALLAPAFQATTIFGSLKSASLVDATLSLVGPDGRERLTYRDVDARYTDRGGGERLIEAELDGAHGPWRIRGSIREGGERSADLRAEDIPIADALLLAGLPELPDGSDLKLSFWLRSSVEGQRLAALDGGFSTGPGMVTRPRRPPVQIDAADGAIHWNEATGAFDLSRLAVRSGATRVELAGGMTPAPGGGWRLDLAGRDLAVAGATAADPPVAVDALTVAATLRDGAVTLDELAVRGKDLDVSLAGSSRSYPEGRDLAGRLEIRKSDARRVMALWPDTSASELRAYLLPHMTRGFVESLSIRPELDPANLRRAIADEPLPDGAIDGRFVLNDATLSLADGVPALQGLGIEGRFNGNSVALRAPGAAMRTPDGRRLMFVDGTYDQADYDLRSTTARIGFRVQGPADAFASLLRSQPLQEAGAPDLDPATLKGRGDMRLALTLPVRDMPASLKGLPITVDGVIADLSAEKLVGREKVEGGNLALSISGGAISLKGEARLSGTPATIDFQAPRTGPGEAVIQLVLDDAARGRRGLPVPPQLAGPLPVKVVATFAAGLRTTTRIEADLARVAVDNLVPGWSKPAGRPGRMSFLLGEGEAPELRDVVLESGAVQIKGRVLLSASGGIDKADLSTLKLSPGDDLRAQVERAGAATKVAIRGNVGDARPILRWASAGASERKGGKEGGDLDLELAVNILTGHNDEALTNVTARLGTRNRDIRALQFSGRFRSAKVEARLAKLEAGDPVVALDTDDAGATLRFLDIYKRAVGGKLGVAVKLRDGSQEGNLTVDGFKLRGEPALRQLVSDAPAQASEERSGPAAPINPSEVQFAKLTAEFRRTASRIDWRDVVMWGPQIGFSLSGSIDYGRDWTDINGTFVPAYALNNAFSQVPLVGLLLGGNANEGLFAIDFHVSGPATAPSFTVNPLSAMAPGILRKFIGAITNPGQEPPQATGAVQGRPER